MQPTPIHTTPPEQALEPIRGSGPPAVRAGTPPEQGVRAAWRALGDSRAVIAGAAVLAAAVVFGVAETGILGILVYRLVRERPPVTFSVRQGIGELTESTMRKVGQALVRPSSGVALSIWAMEVGSIAYFGDRVLMKGRAERRDIAQRTGPESWP